MNARALLGTLFTFVLLLLAASAVRAGVTQSDVSLTTSSGTIQGTLTMPGNPKGAVPVALIVAGSGPTDRNGSNRLGVSVTPYQQLAEAWAANGIASVRYDKRGIAASALSAPLGNPAHFFAYVDDVAAWINWLRADKRFSRVVVVGHSEGSLLAMLAAAKAPADGVVSLEGAGRPAMAVIGEQLSAAGLPAATVDRARAVGHAIVTGEPIPDVPVELQAIFPESLRTYEREWFSVDPADAASVLKAPLLVVQGGADIQVGILDAQRLTDAHPGATLRVYPLMTHLLMDAKSTDRAASIATYNDTSLRIDPAMVVAVAAFIQQRPIPSSP